MPSKIAHSITYQLGSPQLEFGVASIAGHMSSFPRCALQLWSLLRYIFSQTDPSIQEAMTYCDSLNLQVKPAKGISYFTPAQDPPAGTAAEPQSDSSPTPKLFQPLTIRGVTFHNRIGLSPLCQYSSDDGHLSDWHVAHLGGIAQRGPGLVMVEATAVLPEGRITPQDSGLWKDSQVAPLRRVIDFVHSQNQIIGVQLAHAGRKASTIAPWLSSGTVASEELGGWPDNVKGPSDVPHSENFAIPKAMTKQDINQFKKAWVAAVRRAIKAGADFIEIHAAHGFLLFSFLSPVSNKRTDEYGGSFQNRIRLLLEIAALTRQAVGPDVPVFLRISATEWLEESLPEQPSWRLEDTIRFAQILAENSDVDLLDVSNGGNHPAQRCPSIPGTQVSLAVAIKKIVGDKLAVAAVGKINTGELANRLLDEGHLDLTLAGHGFLKNPGLVWAFAEELDVEISMANQIRWAFLTRRGGLFLKKSINS